MLKLRFIAGFLLLAAGPALATPQPAAKQAFQTHCASCHGADRLGGTGPALLPENLSRLRPAAAREVITHGRAATQMPAFGETLDAATIAALAKFIYQAPDVAPQWSSEAIRDSHQVPHPFGSLPDQPKFDADPMNLFLVVEKGDHHVSLLDGDKMERITRFPSRFALHGGPKFTPDGRYVFFGSRDGWITKYDIYNLAVVAEVRAGINMRNIAVSADGRYLMAANYLPHTLVLFNTDNLELLETFPVENEQGQSSRVSAVYAAPPRGSFVAALKDLKEVWEITPSQEGSQVRRLATDDYMDDFFFDPDYRHLIGAGRDGQNGLVLDLDSGEKVAELPLSGMPHLGSGITWMYKGHRVMATPHLKTGKVSIIDMTDWRVVKTLKTDGPGFFMRSHENSPYAWVDVFFGPGKDEVHIIDKRSLEIVKTLKPIPGKTAAHVEFDRNGDKAVLSIWEDEGAVIVYDAHTLEEIKRLPMKKPSGKYNVWNKTHYEEGTSH
ncbi:cytochrome D1 domain-containing protein [Marinobacteraceae bacterium S3BR75-40.1]